MLRMLQPCTTQITAPVLAFTQWEPQTSLGLLPHPGLFTYTDRHMSVDALTQPSIAHPTFCRLPLDAAAGMVW